MAAPRLLTIASGSVPGTTRATLPIATGTAATLTAIASWTATLARRTAAATATGSDAGELLDGLAGDLRVLGEAQSDAAALAVDLDHAHADLIAAVEHVLDRLHALAGRDVGDVQQTVGAL